MKYLLATARAAVFAVPNSCAVRDENLVFGED
jgi:hypothetical protein